MEPYKANFIQFLLDKDVLRVGGPFALKSGRQSPYFIDLGAVSDGSGLAQLGDAYAASILEHVRPEDFDGIIGIPSRAHTFGSGISIALANRGVNRSYSSYRDNPKTYGVATSQGASNKSQRQKEYVLGASISDDSRLILVDDVMTAGDAKEAAIEMVTSFADVTFPALFIAVNRQEVNEYGENAINDFSREHNIPVHAVVTAGDIFDYLKELGRISSDHEKQFLSYMRAWGTKDVREKYDLKSKRFLEGKKVIPACDTSDIERFRRIVAETADIEKIGGYKIGFELGLLYSLPEIVSIVRELAPEKRVIYDHQKAGTDIPDTGLNFARVMKRSGVDAAIVFPQAGPVTEVRWIGELLQQGIEVFVGGEMTHKGYKRSERGYIADEALEEMYLRGARMGVVNFIVPGTRVDRISAYRKLLEDEGIDPFLASPGLVTQGGSMSEAGNSAGNNFGAIVGRDIVNAHDIRAKALELTSRL